MDCGHCEISNDHCQYVTTTVMVFKCTHWEIVRRKRKIGIIKNLSLTRDLRFFYKNDNETCVLPDVVWCSLEVTILRHHIPESRSCVSLPHECTFNVMSHKSSRLVCHLIWKYNYKHFGIKMFSLRHGSQTYKPNM